MHSNPRKGAPAPRDRGFVLIGVVMFVLALTILGLSLFSLSGYEAQFLGHSRDAAQAFYDTIGGLDRARFMLITRDRLQSVQDTLDYDGPEGVVYARARYTGGTMDSVGPVDWSGTRDIEIRVRARRNDAWRMVECRFTPHGANDYYKRLMTSTGRLDFVSDPAHIAHRPNTYLTGDVWLNNPTTATWYLPPPAPPIGSLPNLASQGVVPQPSIGAFFAAHFSNPGTHPILEQDVPLKTFDLFSLGSPNTVTFFSTSTPPGWPEMACIWHTSEYAKIKVQGYAVWMLDTGMYFRRRVEVEGSPQDCLVIVAKRWNSGNHEAIWFDGGLHSPNVPVILVAEDDVGIEQGAWDADKSTRIEYLSIFSGGARIFVGGPLTIPNQMQILHVVGAAEDQPAGLIDILHSLGGLPDPPAGDRMARLAGTWREVMESNPN